MDLKELFEDVKTSLVNLKTLEIHTIIGKFSWDSSKNQIVCNEGEVKRILTQINLLGGDVTTALSEDFLREPYDKVWAFHKEQENKGHEIIEGNLKALREFIDLILQLWNVKDVVK